MEALASYINLLKSTYPDERKIAVRGIDKLLNKSSQERVLDGIFDVLRSRETYSIGDGILCTYQSTILSRIESLIENDNRPVFVKFVGVLLDTQFDLFAKEEQWELFQRSCNSFTEYEAKYGTSDDHVSMVRVTKDQLSALLYQHISKQKSLGRTSDKERRRWLWTKGAEQFINVLRINLRVDDQHEREISTALASLYGQLSGGNYPKMEAKIVGIIKERILVIKGWTYNFLLMIGERMLQSKFRGISSAEPTFSMLLQNVPDWTVRILQDLVTNDLDYIRIEARKIIDAVFDEPETGKEVEFVEGKKTITAVGLSWFGQSTRRVKVIVNKLILMRFMIQEVRDVEYRTNLWNRIIGYARNDELEEDTRANAIDYLLNSYDGVLVKRGERYLKKVRSKYRKNKLFASVFDDSQNVHDEHINASNMSSLIRLTEWADENIDYSYTSAQAVEDMMVQAKTDSGSADFENISFAEVNGALMRIITDKTKFTHKNISMPTAIRAIWSWVCYASDDKELLRKNPTVFRDLRKGIWSGLADADITCASGHIARSLAALIGSCDMVEQRVNPIEMVKLEFINQVYKHVQELEDEDLQGDLLVEIGCSEPESRETLNRYVREIAVKVYAHIAPEFGLELNEEGFLCDGKTPVHDIVFPYANAKSSDDSDEEDDDDLTEEPKRKVVVSESSDEEELMVKSRKSKGRK